MPRPMSYGRPGTEVVPAAWETDHAPVATATMRATVAIRAPYDAPVPGDVLYSGPARIQVQDTQGGEISTGDQQVSVLSYLVAIDRGADDVVVNAPIQITDCDDPTLLGDRRLLVKGIVRGTERWQRDLYCIDDNG